MGLLKQPDHMAPNKCGRQFGAAWVAIFFPQYATNFHGAETGFWPLEKRNDWYMFNCGKRTVICEAKLPKW
jgi:hypothetical protein